MPPNRSGQVRSGVSRFQSSDAAVFVKVFRWLSLLAHRPYYFLGRSSQAVTIFPWQVLRGGLITMPTLGLVFRQQTRLLQTHKWWPMEVATLSGFAAHEKERHVSSILAKGCAVIGLLPPLPLRPGTPYSSGPQTHYVHYLFL